MVYHKVIISCLYLSEITVIMPTQIRIWCNRRGIMFSDTSVSCLILYIVYATEIDLGTKCVVDMKDDQTVLYHPDAPFGEPHKKGRYAIILLFFHISSLCSIAAALVTLSTITIAMPQPSVSSVLNIQSVFQLLWV